MRGTDGAPGPQKVNRHGLEFKFKAVQLNDQPGVLIKDVAESLCIHPFMLSRWRKQVRDGELSGVVPKIDTAAVGELRRLREVERKFKRLQCRDSPSRDNQAQPFLRAGPRRRAEAH